MAAALAAGVLVCAPASAAASPRVTIAVLPSDTSVSPLADAGLSVGVLSAGIGEVPATQTYLDVSQGNRVNEALYDRDVPAIPPFGEAVPQWLRVQARAGSAPAEIVPGLLGSTLAGSGIRIDVESSSLADRAVLGLLAVDLHGQVRRVAPGTCLARTCPGLSVLRATPGNLPSLLDQLRGEDLLIAVAAPPPAEHGTLPIGIAGAGFDGNLTSDSTRTPGYVLATDLAPTILDRLGLPEPDEMNGELIRAEGGTGAASVHDRAERMTAVAERRVPLLAGCLLAWIGLAAMAAFLWPRGEGREPMRRRAAAWAGLSVAWLPLVLLIGASLEPSPVAEGLLIGLGSPALAVATLALLPGWRGLAVACASVALAYGVDMGAGSPLTTLSLLGPNPVLGVRFYGIGNELEAIVAVLVPVGVGAGLTAADTPPSRRVAIGAFLSAGLVGGLVFGAGRFGADVGAAIALPAGAAVAAALVPGWKAPPGRRWPAVPALVAAISIGLIALLLVDLISGGDAHLTRSVLASGGLGDLGDAVERRLRLSAHDFSRAAASPLFWVLVAGALVALALRRTIDHWLSLAPRVRAGVIGGAVAVLVGALVNDSGGTYLAVGAVALGAALAFSWAQIPRNTRLNPGK